MEAAEQRRVIHDTKVNVQGAINLIFVLLRKVSPSAKTSVWKRGKQILLLKCGFPNVIKKSKKEMLVYWSINSKNQGEHHQRVIFFNDQILSSLS